ncbi:ferritin-like domain-containing protein [Nocardioides sp.]|uniref:ferritin-like domain-containing protein n=1 Tax=Nocardioides sp. TaxID=35761 RepID=UPI003D0BA8E8
MPTTLESLQSTLSGEHAAVWLYAVLGGQTSRSSQPLLFETLTRSYGVHRSRRDQLISMIRDLGVVPAAAAAAYDLPNDASTPTKVNRAAREIESRCAGLYAELVAGTYDSQRRWAIGALTDAAVRGLDYRGSPEIFPGLAEFADR